MSPDAWSGIAQAILEGFDRHYALFREYSRAGKTFFENADWKGAAQIKDIEHDAPAGKKDKVAVVICRVDDAGGDSEFTVFTAIIGPSKVLIP